MRGAGMVLAVRAAVIDAFLRLSVPLEGRVPFLYCDHLGLVTIGVGNLIDASPNPAPWAPALGLPLKHIDGTHATVDEVKAAWHAVKARTDLTQRGGMAYRSVTDLRLSERDIDALVSTKLAQVGRQLETRWPVAHGSMGFVDWPADAQLAAVSMAWAMGDAGFKRFPRFSAFMRIGDFTGAATECLMQPDKGTLKQRNKDNAVMLVNAGRVVAQSLNPDLLYYPHVLTSEPPTAA